MANINTMNLMIICCLIFAIWPAYAEAAALNEQVYLSQTLCSRRLKTARLHFYLQDVQEGPNATVWEVARSDITSNSRTDFGLVRVFDDLITERPDPKSRKVGRAQGLLTSSGLEESTITMNLNLYLTSGRYKGSTLTVVGLNPIAQTKNRELPVVGGTGLFRMARGYTISSTYSYDVRTNYGVIEYTVHVVYPEEQPRLDDDQSLVSGY